MLADSQRGATLEAVVTRMKTIQSVTTARSKVASNGVRFIAVSATVPNADDVSLPCSQYICCMLMH